MRIQARSALLSMGKRGKKRQNSIGQKLLRAEEVILEAVDNGSTQTHIIHFVYNWLKENYPKGQEEYHDGTHPVFECGLIPNKNSKGMQNLNGLSPILSSICRRSHLQWGDVLGLFRAYLEIHLPFKKGKAFPMKYTHHKF